MPFWVTRRDDDRPKRYKHEVIEVCSFHVYVICHIANAKLVPVATMVNQLQWKSCGGWTKVRHCTHDLLNSLENGIALSCIWNVL
jgi:hypothetical protein